MAANAIKYPLSRVSKRGLAAQAATKSIESTSSAPEIISTVMPNKLMVSTLDLGGPLSRVSITFKVGPRNETNKNLGVAHIIRSMTGFSSEKCTGFAIVRNIQQSGAHFTCTGDREYTAYHVFGVRNKIFDTLKYLSAAVTAPAFKPWQVMDNFPRLKYEIGCLTPQARVIDILHKLAFRNGLGNSLFVRKDLIGTHTPDMLCRFYKEGFTANRCVVSGYNIEHKEMIEFAKSMELPSNDPLPGNANYYGGEIRKDKNSYFAHVAIGTKGTGAKDLKESLVYAVLQHAYGVNPSIKWGGSPSLLHKAVAPVAPDAGVSCFNMNYTDTGLFGFIVSSSSKTAGKAVEAAFKVLSSGKVTEADVKRGKAMLKMNILSSSEISENILDDMCIQSLQGGVIIPATIIAEALDKITLGEVTAAAKKIASEKFSFAGIGDLSEVPYLSDLK